MKKTLMASAAHTKLRMNRARDSIESPIKTKDRMSVRRVADRVNWRDLRIVVNSLLFRQGIVTTEPICTARSGTVNSRRVPAIWRRQGVRAVSSNGIS